MNQEIKVELLMESKPTMFSEKDIEVHYNGVEIFPINMKYDNATGILSFGWEIDYELDKEVIKEIIETFEIRYFDCRRFFTVNLIMEEWEIYGLDNDNYMLTDDDGNAYESIEDFKAYNLPYEGSLGFYNYTKLANGDIYRFKAIKDCAYSLECSYHWVDFEKIKI